jgi:predicted ABC-type sugar transport system permease subunit
MCRVLWRCLSCLPSDDAMAGTYRLLVTVVRGMFSIFVGMIICLFFTNWSGPSDLAIFFFKNGQFHIFWELSGGFIFSQGYLMTFTAIFSPTFGKIANYSAIKITIAIIPSFLSVRIAQFLIDSQKFMTIYFKKKSPHQHLNLVPYLIFSSITFHFHKSELEQNTNFNLIKILFFTFHAPFLSLINIMFHIHWMTILSTHIQTVWFQLEKNPYLANISLSVS